MEIMNEISPYPNLTPWVPSPEPIHEEWMHLINTLIQQGTGTNTNAQPALRGNAQIVGETLHRWGLPWKVVVAGYLWSCDEKYLRRAALPATENILAHIRQAHVYARYIARENLPPLLTPPYRDPGALLIACVASF